MAARLVTASAFWKKVSASPLCMLWPQQLPTELPLQWGPPCPPGWLNPPYAPAAGITYTFTSFPLRLWTTSGHRLTPILNLWHLTWWLAGKGWLNKGLSNECGHRPSALVTGANPTCVFWTFCLLLLFPCTPNLPFLFSVTNTYLFKGLVFSLGCKVESLGGALQIK